MESRESKEKERFYSVAVSPSFDERVRARMAAGGFNSISEYLRYAIREDLEREAEREVEASLLEAVRRGNFTEVTPEYFAKLRARVRAAEEKARAEEEK
jgi:Arc/MetJ-type ribon-helix-helix transcriptional regulator